MHIPSARVQKEMAREPAYLWFVPAKGADTLAILLKAPTNCLKAIIRGCSTEFVFTSVRGRRRHYLGIAARIYDDLASPFSVMKLQRVNEEHKTLVNVLRRRSTPIFLFDELCRCVAWGNCNFLDEDRNRVLTLLQNTNLYVGKMNRMGNQMLDRLQVSVDPSSNIQDAVSTPLLLTQVQITDIETIEHGAIGFYQTHRYDIGNRAEGLAQEISAWHALESLFPLDISRGPEVEEGPTKRELIDILCHYELGVFLFESKALSVYNANLKQTMDRKVLNLQNHVRKALSQLRGAVRSIRQGRLIRTQKGEPIYLDASIPPHCVVILPELFQFGNWDRIVEECLDLSRSDRALFQILDMRELITMIAVSGTKEGFDINLSERFREFTKVRSPFLRGVGAP